MIPYIVKPMAELRDGSEQVLQYPKFCPINKNEQVALVREEGESAWRCPVCTCGAQDYQRFVYHASKDAMDIEGLSKATIERFQELGWLKTIADFYRLDYDKISKLEGFGKRSAENLEKAINIAKKNPIRRVLNSLAVHHLGRKASKLLAAEVNHVLDFVDFDVARLTAIKDIGPVLAQNVVDYFHDEKNIAVLKDMENLGVNLTATDEDRKPAQNTEGVLFGKTILFTGTLMQFPREQAEKAAAAAGATIASSVSKKLSILVVGENAGSKLKKAQDLKIVQILSEQEFLDLIK